MKLLITLLLLASLPVFASQEDVYILELQSKISQLEWKMQNGIASEQEEYMLKHYIERLEQLSENDSYTLKQEDDMVEFTSSLIDFKGKTVMHEWYRNGEFTNAQVFKIVNDLITILTSTSADRGDIIEVHVIVEDETVAVKTLSVK